MANTQPTRRMPQLHVSTREILAHATNARATAALTGDISALLAEITRLYTELIHARLRAANLEAAMLAALHAQEDGDYDPTGYLRDEITPDAGGAYGP